jgi:hypothetical protein
MSTATLEIRSAAVAPRSAVGRPVQRPSGSSAVRLTRRGRLVLSLFLLVTLTAAVVAGAASVSARTTAAAAPATVEVVVQPGQTLWELAEEVAPGADPREVVREIRELNALAGSSVVPGQPLTVPAA